MICFKRKIRKKHKLKAEILKEKIHITIPACDTAEMRTCF